MEKQRMLLLVISLLLALLPLAGVAYIALQVLSGGLTVDALFMGLILLTISGIFLLNALIELRKLRRARMTPAPAPAAATAAPAAPAVATSRAAPAASASTQAAQTTPPAAATPPTTAVPTSAAASEPAGPGKPPVAAKPLPTTPGVGRSEEGVVEDFSYFEAPIGESNKSFVWFRANGASASRVIVFQGDMRNALPRGKRVKITYTGGDDANQLLSVD